MARELLSHLGSALLIEQQMVGRVQIDDTPEILVGPARLGAAVCPAAGRIRDFRTLYARSIASWGSFREPSKRH